MVKLGKELKIIEYRRCPYCESAYQGNGKQTIYLYRLHLKTAHNAIDTPDEPIHMQMNALDNSMCTKCQNKLNHCICPGGEGAKFKEELIQLTRAEKEQVVRQVHEQIQLARKSITVLNKLNHQEIPREKFKQVTNEHNITFKTAIKTLRTLAAATS